MAGFSGMPVIRWISRKTVSSSCLRRHSSLPNLRRRSCGRRLTAAGRAWRMRKRWCGSSPPHTPSFSPSVSRRHWCMTGHIWQISLAWSQACCVFSEGALLT